MQVDDGLVLLKHLLRILLLIQLLLMHFFLVEFAEEAGLLGLLLWLLIILTCIPMLQLFSLSLLQTEQRLQLAGCSKIRVLGNRLDHLICLLLGLGKILLIRQSSLLVLFFFLLLSSEEFARLLLLCFFFVDFGNGSIEYASGLQVGERVESVSAGGRAGGCD